MTITNILLLVRQIQVVGNSVFLKGKAEILRSVLLLAVSGGKGREEDSAYDWPRRDGCLFHLYDHLLVVEGEYSLSEGEGGDGKRRL